MTSPVQYTVQILMPFGSKFVFRLRPSGPIIVIPYIFEQVNLPYHSVLSQRTNEPTKNATIYAIAHGPASTSWYPSVPLELWEHHGEYGVCCLNHVWMDTLRLRREFECRVVLPTKVYSNCCVQCTRENPGVWD